MSEIRDTTKYEIQCIIAQKRYKLVSDAEIAKEILSIPELAIVDRDAHKQLDISDMLPDILRRSWPRRVGAKSAIEYMINAGYVLEVKE